MDLELEYIKKKLKDNPRDAGLLKLLGAHELMAGNYREAVEHYGLAILFNPRILPEIELDYERLLESESHNLPARLSLAEFYLKGGEFEEAVTTLEEILEIHPYYLQAYNTLGYIYLKTDRLNQAISLFEKASNQGIKDSSLTEQLAGAHLEKGELGKAIALYEEMLTLEPKSKKLLRILGELYERVGKFEESAESYVRMFEEDPEVATEVCHKLEEIVKASGGKVRVKELLAYIYVKCLKPDQAVREHREILEVEEEKLDQVIGSYREILKIYPDHPQTILFLSQALTLKGSYSEAVEGYNKLLELNSGFIEETISGHKKIIELLPGQVLAYESLAKAYLAKGQVEEALQAFQKVLRLNPEEAEIISQKCKELLKDHAHLPLVHQILGETLLIKGEIKRAIQEGEKIISLDKDSPWGYVLVGDGYTKAQVWGKTREAYRTAISLDPYNAAIHQKYEKAVMSELKEEEETLKRRIDEDPWKLSLHLDLAKIYYRRGEVEEAIQELQIAVRDQARAAFAYNLQGLCYREEGRFDVAVVQFQRAKQSLKEEEIPDLAKRVRFNLGTCLEAQGLISEATAVYEDILQEDIRFGNLRERINLLNTSNPASLRNKVLVGILDNFRSQRIIGLWGRDGRRIDLLKSTEVLSLSFGGEHNTTGFEHYLKSRFKAAEEEFSIAIQLHVNLPSALNNLGFVYLKYGKLEQAEMRIKEAVESDPDFAVLRNNLGLTYLLKGEKDMAEEEFRRALELDRHMTPAFINLGNVLYLKGKVKEALASYERVGDFNPLSEFANRRLMYMKV